MKKVILYTGIIFFLYTSLLFSADTPAFPVVAVFMPENPSNDSTFSQLAYTIKENIDFTLKLMKRYRIVDPVSAVSSDKINDLNEYAQNQKIDCIIFGKIYKDTDQKIKIGMSVYDRFKEGVTVSQNVSIDDIFGIFDAADYLVIKLIEGFSGVHVGYGSIALTNTGEAGDYEVFIDDIAIGRSLINIKKVFIGRHRLDIKQNRMFGEYIILDKEIEVKEDDIIPVSFSVPYLTEEEEESLHVLDKLICENYADYGKKETVEKAYAEAIALLGDVGYCKKLAGLKEKFISGKTVFAEKESYTSWSRKNMSAVLSRKKNDYSLQKDSHPDTIFSLPGNSGVLASYLASAAGYLVFQKFASAICYTKDPKIIDSFAVPILRAVETLKPDFTDDFSADTGWNKGYNGGNYYSDSSLNRYRRIENGRLNIYAGGVNEQQKYYVVANDKIFYKHFILSIETFNVPDNTRIGVIRIWNSPFGSFWLQIMNGGVSLGYYYDNTKYTFTIIKYIEFTKLKESCVINLIAINNSIALYIDDKPVFYFFSKDLPVGQYQLIGGDFSGSAQALTVSYDNLKIWNLDTIKF